MEIAKENAFSKKPKQAFSCCDEKFRQCLHERKIPQKREQQHQQVYVFLENKRDDYKFTKMPQNDANILLHILNIL